MAQVCSIADLKERPNAIIEEVRSSKEPMYLAQGGTSTVVLIDADTYLTKMQALGEFERIYRDNSTKPRFSEGSEEPEEGRGGVSGKVVWRCKVCGHMVEMDELPDDFVCPLCGVGKDMFERIER